MKLNVQCPICQVQFCVERPREYVLGMSCVRFPSPLSELESGLYSAVCSRECDRVGVQRTLGKFGAFTWVRPPKGVDPEPK